MFQIKICGVTTPVDAAMIAVAGADAIGLNFYSGSLRYLTPQVAAEIVAVLPQQMARVGVFVNMPVFEIVKLADQLRLDWIQLHGDEPPEFFAKLAPRRVLKAFRYGKGGLNDIAEYLARCQLLGAMPAAVLIDAAVPGAYGGTGQKAEWTDLTLPRDWLFGLPLVLAGGLTPENVAEAIANVHPDAVDTASGVESSPGHKDRNKVECFVNAASSAFKAPNGSS